MELADYKKWQKLATTDRTDLTSVSLSSGGYHYGGLSATAPLNALMIAES